MKTGAWLSVVEDFLCKLNNKSSISQLTMWQITVFVRIINALVCLSDNVFKLDTMDLAISRQPCNFSSPQTLKSENCTVSEDFIPEELDSELSSVKDLLWKLTLNKSPLK